MTTTGPSDTSQEGYARIAPWPALIALLVIGGIYAFLPDELRVGPPWLLLLLVALAVLPIVVPHLRGHPPIHPLIGRVVAVVVTAAVVVSVVLLLTGLPSGRTGGRLLLRDASLLWIINLLTFALWYWEVDGGGPHQRKIHPYRSTDFVFPQLVDREESVDWWPNFLDYIFLAFNTSTAFSPTDTLVLSRRAKAIMMSQSFISLLLVAGLVSRALNTL